MTLNIISDIHATYIKSHFNDFKDDGGYVYYDNGFNPSKLKKADYLVIAGDLGWNDTYKKVYEDIKSKTKRKFKDIFYIRGNHDYWQYPNRTSDHIEHNNDEYLEVEVGDYVILGCTLWSPIINNKDYVESVMVDYKLIPNFNTTDSTKLFEIESYWLLEKYDYYKSLGKKIIIITHHTPIKSLIPSRFIGDKANCAFTVMDGSLDKINPDLWICGHTHDKCDETINGTRYVRNPIGYNGEVPNKYWYNTIIEV